MHQTVTPHATRPGPWYATLSGLSATFVGIGLARFAYTHLLFTISSGAVAAALLIDLAVGASRRTTS